MARTIAALALLVLTSSAAADTLLIDGIDTALGPLRHCPGCELRPGDNVSLLIRPDDVLHDDYLELFADASGKGSGSLVASASLAADADELQMESAGLPVIEIYNVTTDRPPAALKSQAAPTLSCLVNL